MGFCSGVPDGFCRELSCVNGKKPEPSELRGGTGIEDRQRPHRVVEAGLEGYVAMAMEDEVAPPNEPADQVIQHRRFR
jgi:hypothetical protein